MPSPSPRRNSEEDRVEKHHAQGINADHWQGPAHLWRLRTTPRCLVGCPQSMTSTCHGSLLVPTSSYTELGARKPRCPIWRPNRSCIPAPLNVPINDKGPMSPMASRPTGRGLPRPPKVPLFRALWYLFDGIWGLLKGSWGVLVLMKAPYEQKHLGGASRHRGPARRYEKNTGLTQTSEILSTDCEHAYKPFWETYLVFAYDSVCHSFKQT